jgi:leucyl/phenylalanyl-tRNA--protein transferase
VTLRAPLATGPRAYRGTMRTPAPDHPSLSPDALLAAYAHGYFPMDAPGARGPVGLYEADPRSVIPVEAFRTPRSVRRGVGRAGYEVRVDTAFDAVAHACAERRDGVWLTPRLVRAYVGLHRAGWAHSVETWREGVLCGGLFGVALGSMFSSETMFHRAPDAGNAAVVATAALLARAGYTLWDIQAASEHTRRFGAVAISPQEYRRRLADALARPGRPLVV